MTADHGHGQQIVVPNSPYGSRICFRAAHENRLRPRQINHTRRLGLADQLAQADRA